MVVHVFFFVISKVKRRLEKKPPKRNTISTTPRFLMKKKGKVPDKQATNVEQKGEETPQTTPLKQKGGKNTKRLKKRNKTPKEKTENLQKVSQKTGSNSSGAKLKK